MTMFPMLAILLVLVAAPAGAWESASVPTAVLAKLPEGHVARVATCSETLDPPNPICIVIAARPEEGNGRSLQRSPQRPLLVYRVDDGTALLIARNDRIVLRRDEGGQCDPVEDAGAIAVKGRFFTLESGVACGQHWTDFTTFRFDPRTRAFVWHSRIFESERLNDDPSPDAEALVRDQRHVWRANPTQPVKLADYVPR
jgi:hypothetical protein